MFIRIGLLFIAPICLAQTVPAQEASTALAGKDFDIMVVGQQATDHLVFGKTSVSSKAFDLALPYTVTEDKNHVCHFTASTIIGDGSTLTIAGEVAKTSIHGSLTLTPRTGKAVTVVFRKR